MDNGRFRVREQAFIRPVKEIESVDRAEEYITFFGENTYVHIEPLTVDMLDPMNMGQIQTVFVNGLKSGDNADLGIGTILANAGDEDVDIDITLLTGEHIEMTVKTGEIYATDWMSVSSIVIK